MSETDSAVIEALPISSDRQGIPFESIIAKQKGSCYVPRPTNQRLGQVQAEPVRGVRARRLYAGNPFDALIVGCYDGPKLNFVAKVRAGFVPHVRREVFQRLRGMETQRCRFANLPEKRHTWWALTAEEMKDCRWLTPELVAQVEFREWTPEGHLRHCSFVALRDDKPDSVVREAIT